MESWRGFLSEEVESNEKLTEQELEELFGKANWEKLVDVWAQTDAENTEAATKAGLQAMTTDDKGNPVSPQQIVRNAQAIIAAAAETKDPEAVQIATNVIKTADEKAPELNLDQAVTSVDVEEVPDEETTAPTAGLEIDRSMLMKIVKNPEARVGPTMVFRTRLTKYLQSVGLPRSINRMSPVVQGIVDVIRQAAMAANSSLGSTNLPAMGGDAGSSSLSANLEEKIEKIFVPIILEEVKREKVRRILVEIGKAVIK